MGQYVSKELMGTQNIANEQVVSSRRQRPRPGFIAELLAHPVYSLASRINAQHFGTLARRRAVSTRALHWPAVLVSIGVSQRLAVVSRGRLSALLVQKLICSQSELQHATAVVSRRHFVGLKNSNTASAFTLQGNSVAFHPSAPYLATGGHEKTSKLWLLNADCSAATCVSTLQGHSDLVWCVAFHPSAPYLATGSLDKTSKLWLLNADCSAATCVSTLQGHSDLVRCVAFHPSAPYLATGSHDKTVKLWLLNADCSAATCVSTLQGFHSDHVTSVAFHPSAPYVATSSHDMTAKLWQLNADCSAATCVYTLRGHSKSVSRVAFHPSAPYLATCSTDDTAKLWQLNADCSAATCVYTLQHSKSVFSVAFHPSAPYLATGCSDGTAKLWLLNADCSAATCVSTLQGHSRWVCSVAFHPSAPYLATCSNDGTAKLWRWHAFVPYCSSFYFMFIRLLISTAYWSGTAIACTSELSIAVIHAISSTQQTLIKPCSAHHACHCEQRAAHAQLRANPSNETVNENQKIVKMKNSDPGPHRKSEEWRTSVTCMWGREMMWLSVRQKHGIQLEFRICPLFGFRIPTKRLVIKAALLTIVILLTAINAHKTSLYY
jgi:hypothetical protein